jgi:putative protease
MSGSSISENNVRLSMKIDSLNSLDYILSENIYKIYIALTGKTVTHLQKDSDIVDKLLKNKDKVVFSLPTIMRDLWNGPETYDYFKKAVQALMTKGFKQFQISNPGGMGLFEGEDVLLYADYALYCLNPLSITKLRELGLCRYTLSPEDGKENLCTLFSENTDLIIYQDTPLFTSETCVWANTKGLCPGIAKCSFEQMELRNEYGDRFMATNDACRTVVISESPFSIIHLIQTLLDAGQRDFRIDLCYKDYTPERIHDILSGIKNRKKMKDSTIGNFERGLI